MITTFTVTANQKRDITLEESGEYVIKLVGSGAEAQIKGAFQSSGTQKIDVSVVIHHQAPHTRATTTLRGVGKDQASVKFVGRIKIDEKCGDTNSFLTERILLLSDKATAEAIPDLEILSDDVKCSHAASISRIPEEHLFYLMARGLNRFQAEDLVVEGFLSL